MLTHKGTQTIETERLILRRFRPSDAEDMFRNWANDPEVTRYLSWSPHGNVENTKRLLQEWDASYADVKVYIWAIVPKSYGKVIGSIGLLGVNDASQKCEAGYCMSKAYWRQGIMPEALTAVLRYAFEQCGFNRVQAIHDVRNPASGRVMEKGGMQSEGVLRQYHVNNRGDEFADCRMWAILKEDWGKARCIAAAERQMGSAPSA